MARHYDWSPLGLGSDPIPGDPDEVADAAKRLRDTADAIRSAHDSIKQAANQCGSISEDSDAVDSFMDNADDVASKMIKALPRYEAAADALKSYSSDLAHAQSMSVTALHMAQNAESDRQAEMAKEEPPGPFDVTPATQAMDAAHKKLNEAVNLRDTSAESAKKKIHNVIDDDDVKDSFWDNMSKVADILSTISAVLGALALVVNFIPVIGQVLSAALGALALITGILALVLHLGYAIENGEGWDAVIFDAIGVLTFGIGSAAVGGARGMGLAVKSLGWSKLRGVQGISSRLAGSAFKTKGPMTKAMAKEFMKNGAFGVGKGRYFSAAFGGLGGDLSAALKALRGYGVNGTMGALHLTPSNLRAMLPGLTRPGALTDMLQGAPELTSIIRNARTIGDFGDVANVSRLVEMANEASKLRNISHVSFGLGNLGTLADNVLDVDIPVIR